MQLFPYQIDGARFLATTKRALLADDMGLGKSAQAIAACDQIDGCLSVAVVCPASLVENWKREIAKFKTGHWTAQVTSYNRAAESPFPGEEFDVLILDEAHYLKSPKAKRTKAIFGEKCDGVGGLVSRAAHVFCLTGTPTPNNPSELWPMLRAVIPGAIEAPTKTGKMRPLPYWPFVSKFCVTQDTGFGIKIIKGRNLSLLKSSIAPFVLRRKKDEVLKDLPPIRFDTLALEGDKLPHDDTGWDHITLALKNEGVAGLKAIAPHVAQLRRVTGLAKAPAAAEWIDAQLDGGIKKLVVFAHHRDVIKVLSNSLREGQHGHVVLDGSKSSEDRDAAVWNFQNEESCRVFIGQIQAAGTGLTLTAASDVLFVESSWVPAENEQAAMRVHRIGQRNACLVRFAMLAGSIDEDIQKAVMRKTADISRLFS